MSKAMAMALLAAASLAHPARGQRAPQAADPLAGLSDQIAATLQRLPVVPGLAVAVVRGDSVIFRQGFGYADVRARRPVTPDTRFYIASTTKSFTATAARLLAADGKLALDSSMTAYLKELALAPPLNGEHVSIRDLLAHRSGIRNDALSFLTSFSGEYTPEGLLTLLHERSTPRSRAFSYTNLGYIITGMAIHRVTGMPWQSTVQTRILDPLGLQATGFSLAEVPRDQVALPYVVEVDGPRELVLRPAGRTTAAGGMVSTVNDLAKWVQVNMHDGVYGGRRIFPQEAMRELHAPQIAVDKPFGGFTRFAYGLGWYLVSYADRTMVQCFGSYAGYRAHVSYIPDADVGVVVLGNDAKGGLYVPDLIAQSIYDRLLALPDAPARHEVRLKEAEDFARRARQSLPPPDWTRPIRVRSAPLKRYVGTYQSRDFGRVVVRAQQGGLHATLGKLSSYLEHVEGDKFRADFVPGQLQGASEVVFTDSDSTVAGPRKDVAQTMAIDLAQGAVFHRVMESN